MGEAADDMLEGLVCSECGEWFDDILEGAEAPGYPRQCAACAPRPVAKREKRKTR